MAIASVLSQGASRVTPLRHSISHNGAHARPVCVRQTSTDELFTDGRVRFCSSCSTSRRASPDPCSRTSPYLSTMVSGAVENSIGRSRDCSTGATPFHKSCVWRLSLTPLRRNSLLIQRKLIQNPPPVPDTNSGRIEGLNPRSQTTDSPVPVFLHNQVQNSHFGPIGDFGPCRLDWVGACAEWTTLWCCM